jgi:hypothetical protein
MKLKELISKTEQRQESFNIMLHHVENIDNPLIVETGCVRMLDDWGAGYSTVIFDTFINESNKGEFHSVDITPKNVEFATSLVSNKSNIHCEDSVTFLYRNAKQWSDSKRKIDLLYLDSYDYNPEEEHQSSLHHIFEFLAAQKAIGTGTMICVDDNFGDRGKGLYLKQYFDSIGLTMKFNDYQWIWVIE